MREMSEKAVKARIRGRVRGVCFRAWTCEEATAKGLKGWVRNRADGTVEAVFAGASEAVDAMLAQCRTGPPAARVDEVETRAVEPVPAFHDFEIRYR